MKVADGTPHGVRPVPIGPRQSTRSDMNGRIMLDVPHRSEYRFKEVNKGYPFIVCGFIARQVVVFDQQSSLTVASGPMQIEFK
jgi:hypothetical protein